MRYLVPLVLLAGCADRHIPPAVATKTVEKLVEIQRPCAVKVPVRPAPLAKPLPTDAVVLVATLALKLREWAGPGQYGDQAEDALKVCTHP